MNKPDVAQKMLQICLKYLPDVFITGMGIPLDIRSLLGKQLLFFDGGMGSLLQEKGLQPGALPELMNLTDPQTIRQIHTQYYQAGSHVVTANTFGANRRKLGDAASVADVIRGGHCVRQGVGREIRGSRYWPYGRAARTARHNALR